MIRISACVCSSRTATPGWCCSRAWSATRSIDRTCSKSPSSPIDAHAELTRENFTEIAVQASRVVAVGVEAQGLVEFRHHAAADLDAGAAERRRERGHIVEDRLVGAAEVAPEIRLQVRLQMRAADEHVALEAAPDAADQCVV